MPTIDLRKTALGAPPVDPSEVDLEAALAILSGAHLRQDPEGEFAIQFGAAPEQSQHDRYAWAWTTVHYWLSQRRGDYLRAN